MDNALTRGTPFFSNVANVRANVTISDLRTMSPMSGRQKGPSWKREGRSGLFEQWTEPRNHEDEENGDGGDARDRDDDRIEQCRLDVFLRRLCALEELAEAAEHSLKAGPCFAGPHHADIEGRKGILLGGNGVGERGAASDAVTQRKQAPLLRGNVDRLAQGPQGFVEGEPRFEEDAELAGYECERPRRQPVRRPQRGNPKSRKGKARDLVHSNRHLAQ